MKAVARMSASSLGMGVVVTAASRRLEVRDSTTDAWTKTRIKESLVDVAISRVSKGVEVSVMKD